MKNICPWCGTAFIKEGNKVSRGKYCCLYCAQCDRRDRCLYKKGITDPEAALAYIKKMLRRIKRRKCCLWGTLSMLQWDRLIMLYDPRVKAEGELGRAIRVIEKLLSLPAMRPLADEAPLWDDIEVVAKRKERKHYEKHVRS